MGGKEGRKGIGKTWRKDRWKHGSKHKKGNERCLEICKKGRNKKKMEDGIHRLVVNITLSYEISPFAGCFVIRLTVHSIP